MILPDTVSKHLHLLIKNDVNKNWKIKNKKIMKNARTILQSIRSGKRFEILKLNMKKKIELDQVTIKDLWASFVLNTKYTCIKESCSSINFKYAII